MVGRGARQLSALNGNMARAHPRGPAGIDQPPDPCRLFQTPGTRLAGFRAGVPLLTLSGQQGPPTFLPAQATDNRGVQLRWVGRGSGASEVKPRGRRTTVALETVGNWYWIVDEIEQAGCIPFLAHAAKAKVMMGNIHKTDKLDAQGLATLLYLGKLPSVWIPPAVVRDERELPRTRMAFAKHRTMVKNRIRSTLAKYALSLDTDSDIFAPKWRPELEAALQRLPPETEYCLRQQLQLLDALNHHIRELEVRILQRIQASPSLQLVQSVPGPAKVLAIVIDRELGSCREEVPCLAQPRAGACPTWVHRDPRVDCAAPGERTHAPWRANRCFRRDRSWCESWRQNDENEEASQSEEAPDSFNQCLTGAALS